MKLNSEKTKFYSEKVIPETLITRILMPSLSGIADKETKPNQLSDSGMGCQYREKV